ncbi:MAG: hypothetical protein ACRDA4_08365 [Filifactoraceae bacterium]
MNKKIKILVLALVAAAIVGIYINETKTDSSTGEHDHSVSQMDILNNALNDNIPILIEFASHT